MFDRILIGMSRAAAGGGAGDGGAGGGALPQRFQAIVAETEYSYSSLEQHLKQDLPRVLGYLNITAESVEMRGALYEPVCNLMKTFHAYRPDMEYDQASL